MSSRNYNECSSPRSKPIKGKGLEKLNKEQLASEAMRLGSPMSKTALKAMPRRDLCETVQMLIKNGPPAKASGSGSSRAAKKAPKKAAPKEPMEVWDYIFYSSAKEHITKGDVDKLKVGEEIEVVLWDRNWADGNHYVEDDDETDPVPAIDFFGNTTTLVYLGNYTFNDITYTEEGDEIDLDALIGDYWTEPKDWTKISANTRVGWRGPMMFWKKLEQAPPLYHSKEHRKLNYK